MSKYLFAWELGQGLGHLVRYQGLVAKLLADGHEVYYAARNVERVREVNPQQALIVEEVRPEFRPKSERIINPRIASYATLLINCGFDDATRLAHRTRRWIECFERIQPDVFICDHSPTALFANRFFGVPVVLAGNSFTVPPSENPFRLYQYWRFEHSEQASAVEAQLTATVNAAQRKISSQAERMAHPSEILNAQRRWLLTFPEFDGYGERDDVRYFGTFDQNQKILLEIEHDNQLLDSKWLTVSGLKKETKAILEAYRGNILNVNLLLADNFIILFNISLKLILLQSKIIS